MYSNISLHSSVRRDVGRFCRLIRRLSSASVYILMRYLLYVLRLFWIWNRMTRILTWKLVQNYNIGAETLAPLDEQGTDRVDMIGSETKKKNREVIYLCINNINICMQWYRKAILHYITLTDQLIQKNLWTSIQWYYYSWVAFVWESNMGSPHILIYLIWC